MEIYVRKEMRGFVKVGIKNERKILKDEKNGKEIYNREKKKEK